MGSFNVACSISHLSIDPGDPVAFVPLTTSKYKESRIGDGRCSLITTECFYEPATLPIFGTYDDYGDMTWEKDAHTAFLEGQGTVVVDTLLPHADDPVIGAGMFIHKEVYETVRDECAMADAWGSREKEWGNKEWLRKKYDEHIAKIKEWREFFTTIPGADHLECPPHSGPFRFDRWETFRELYNDKVIEAQTLRSELIDFVAFYAGMYKVNAFFFPAMNGCQFGNSWAMSALLAKGLEIEKNRIASILEARKEDEREEE